MNALNRVSLIGHIDADPQTIAKGTTCELVTFDIVTRDSCHDFADQYVVSCQLHKVVITDFSAIQYTHMFLGKGDSVFVEGQLQYIDSTSGTNEKIIRTEIVISPTQGCLRRLGEAPVTEFTEFPAANAFCG